MNSPLPAGWVERPLEAVVDPARPITYRIVLPGADYPGGVPYVRVVDMAEGTVQTADLRKTSPEIAGKYRRSALVAGDVLLSIRGHVGRIAIVPPGLEGANLTQDTARIAVRDCDPGYVRWALQGLWIQRWMERHKKGASVKGINLADVRKIPIRLPPLPEQRRIAAILDQADAIRRKRREALRLTEEFLRSAFLEMFGDPVTNPKGWPTVTLGEVAAEMRYGTSAKCSLEAPPGATAILRIPNVVGGEIDRSELKYAVLEDKERRRLALQQGDLLFVRSNGNPKYIGRCAMVRSGEEALFASYLIRVRLAQDSGLQPEFVRHLVTHPRFRSRLVAEARTTAGNYNISTKGLARLRLLQPALTDQRRYLGVAEQVGHLRRCLTSYRDNADDLVDALAQRAFQGEL